MLLSNSIVTQFHPQGKPGTLKQKAGDIILDKPN